MKLNKKRIIILILNFGKFIWLFYHCSILKNTIKCDCNSYVGFLMVPTLCRMIQAGCSITEISFDVVNGVKFKHYILNFNFSASGVNIHFRQVLNLILHLSTWETVVVVVLDEEFGKIRWIYSYIQRNISFQMNQNPKA